MKVLFDPYAEAIRQYQTEALYLAGAFTILAFIRLLVTYVIHRVEQNAKLELNESGVYRDRTE